jgi:predicted component of type VI protein secretion system
MSKKRKGNDRNEVAGLVDRFIQGLISGKMNLDEGDWIVEQLQDLAAGAVPRVAEMLVSPDEEERLAAVVLLRELGDPRAVKPLRQMLHKTDYSDREKLQVIRALDVLGAPIDEATFRRVISDPEALMQDSIDQMLATIEGSAQVEAFLEMMGEAPPEMVESHVRGMLAPLADRRLLLMLTALLHNEHDDIVVAAIDAIEYMKEPATIPLLEERAQYDLSRKVRHAAENAALRLRMRIGDPDEERAPWITPSPLPLAYCLLCTIDGSGGQVLFVAREQPDGDLQVLDLMFNDHEGIKDCFSAVVEEDELDEMIHSFGSAEFVDISLERARAEVIRAYQVTLDAGRRLPPAFLAWRSWIEGEDSRPIEEFPLPSLEPFRQAKLLTECAELVELEEFDFWFFNPDEVASFVPRYRKLLRRGQANRGQAPFEALLDEAIKAVVDSNYRRLLPDRLRRQAWLLAQLYEEEEVSLWALAAAAALEEDVIVEHPLLREMMDISFLNAVGRW